MQRGFRNKKFDLKEFNSYPLCAIHILVFPKLLKEARIRIWQQAAAEELNAVISGMSHSFQQVFNSSVVVPDPDNRNMPHVFEAIFRDPLNWSVPEGKPLFDFFKFEHLGADNEKIQFVLVPMLLFSRFTTKSLGCAKNKAV